MSFSATDVAATRDIRDDDILIAFIGLTGAGRSTFIDLLTGQKNKRAGTSLKPHTDKITATRVMRAGGDDRLVLIDTPGFDDAKKSDMEILQMIEEWLDKMCEKRVRLTGLMHLHRITDNRLVGLSPLKNLRMFGELCGDTAIDRVMLITTMWENLKENTIVGVTRERELVGSFWKPMIWRGSKVERLSRATPDEAWRIVDKVIALGNEKHALQKELLELRLKLSETQQGQELYDSIQKLRSDRERTSMALVERIDKSEEDEIAMGLQAEIEVMEERLLSTFAQVKGLEITIGQRIKRFFFPKEPTKAVGIVVGR